MAVKGLKQQKTDIQIYNKAIEWRNHHLARHLGLWSATHERVDADVSIERTAGHDRRVSVTPLNVKTPLIACRQLIDNLHSDTTSGYNDSF